MFVGTLKILSRLLVVTTTLLRYDHLIFCLRNCQSVRHKTAVFQEYLCSNKIDVCALTETWLSSDGEAVRAECIPIGYMLHDQIRSQRGGGGIALLSRTELSVTPHTAGEKTSFKFTEYIVILGNNKVKVAFIYRTLYNELSYARILIGSHLWSIGRQTYRWRHR